MYVGNAAIKLEFVTTNGNIRFNTSNKGTIFCVGYSMELALVRIIRNKFMIEFKESNVISSARKVSAESEAVQAESVVTDKSGVWVRLYKLFSKTTLLYCACCTSKAVREQAGPAQPLLQVHFGRQL